MMAAALHSNVGLMHATMAIYNAWCDRTPMLIIGATGPWDATKRRPWIDWIHTSSDQGAAHPQLHQVGQPARLGRGRGGEALLRAAQIAQTAPRGPVYVNLDVAMQEQQIDALAAAARRLALSPCRSRRSPRRARREAARAALAGEAAR